MRQNVKINIPAVISGMTIGNGTLNATIQHLSNELLIKVTKEDNILLRGPFKNKSRKAKIKSIVSKFYTSQLLDKPKLEITFSENISAHHQLGNDEGLIVSIYYGLSELHKHGLTREEIMKEVIKDGLIKSDESKAIIYNQLKGGLIASMADQDIYQKIYLPRGIKMVSFLPKTTSNKENEDHRTDFQPELANFILAMQVSNFAALKKSISHLNKDFDAYETCKKNNALGIINSHQVYIALCQNTLDAEKIMTQYIGANYETKISEFDVEGITMY